MKPFIIDNETLKEIRSNSDWRVLFQVLQLKKNEAKSKDHDWWANSPFSNDKTASFHINDKGWYCFSTHQSGGVVDLVQKVVEHRSGQAMNCYEAGQWLIDHGVSHYANAVRNQTKHDHAAVSAINPDRSETKKKAVNEPIRQTLVPVLDMENPIFSDRGISKKTCEYLGCGFLGQKSKSILRERAVFQVRGLEQQDENWKPVILSRIGRATTDEQLEASKWHVYGGFLKTLELYNIDQAFLDSKSLDQIKSSDHLIVVEGCFDVAKLVEADIYNVVATFGSHLSDEQADRLKWLQETLEFEKFLLWYDRDKAGFSGSDSGLELLAEKNIAAKAFDWQQTFPSESRPPVPFPDSITDAGEFSVQQLQWLRSQLII